MDGFSIVTPSFNQAEFLRACVESIRSQDGVPVAYRVMDGGSSDGSRAILESYGGALDWRSEPDGGQARAINAGLSALDGEWCGYLNSDDVLLPGALRRVSEAFVSNPDVDVIYGGAWFIDSSGNRSREYPTLPFALEDLIQHCFICQPAAFWRRRAHDRWGWFDPDFDNTFDYEFWLRLASHGAKFLHIPDMLAGSREHAETKSRRRRGQIFAEIRRMQLRHLGYCGRNWWEQQLRYWRDESGGALRFFIPGRRDQRLYGLAWWPYAFWRYRLGGPLFHRKGHWRA